MFKKINKRLIFVSLIIVISLFITSAVFVVFFNFHKTEDLPSIELTLNSLSPNGKAGGVMIPASCESEPHAGDVCNCELYTCNDEMCTNDDGSQVWGTLECRGICGTADGKTLVLKPVDPLELCSNGIPAPAEPVEHAEDWTWDCQGIQGREDDSCNADKNCDISKTYEWVLVSNDPAEVCLDGACNVRKNALYMCQERDNCDNIDTASDSLCGPLVPAKVTCPACPTNPPGWKEVAD